MTACNELATLRAENARLIKLLESHGIEWLPLQTGGPVPAAGDPEPTGLSTSQKVALFRRLFRGRTDAYPIRWESKTTGNSGYSPACANEWRAGVCEKPRIKCGDCSHRLLMPLADEVIYKHLAGAHTIGVYPLLEDDSCHFLAVDFDDADWRISLDSILVLHTMQRNTLTISHEDDSNCIKGSPDTNHQCSRPRKRV